jgi:hypothetical protein
MAGYTAANAVGAERRARLATNQPRESGRECRLIFRQRSAAIGDRSARSPRRAAHLFIRQMGKRQKTGMCAAPAAFSFHFDLDNFCFHHAALRAAKHPLFVSCITGRCYLSDFHRKAAGLAWGENGISVHFADDLVCHIGQRFCASFSIGSLERLGLLLVLHFVRLSSCASHNVQHALGHPSKIFWTKGRSVDQSGRLLIDAE